MSIRTENFDGSRARIVEADDGTQQHRLAGSRTANQAANLAAKYVEIEMIVHDLVAELGAQAAHADGNLPPRRSAVRLAAPLQRGRPNGPIRMYGHGTARTANRIETAPSRRVPKK